MLTRMGTYQVKTNGGVPEGSGSVRVAGAPGAARMVARAPAGYRGGSIAPLGARADLAVSGSAATLRLYK